MIPTREEILANLSDVMAQALTSKRYNAEEKRRIEAAKPSFTTFSDRALWELKNESRALLLTHLVEKSLTLVQSSGTPGKQGASDYRFALINACDGHEE